MSRGYNSAMIVGNLCQQPILKKTDSERLFTTVTIAVGRPKRPGQQTESKTDFISVTAWQMGARILCENCSKGDTVLITGYVSSYTSTDPEGKRFTQQQITAIDVMPLARRTRVDAPAAERSDYDVNNGDDVNNGAAFLDGDSDGLPFDL